MSTDDTATDDTVTDDSIVLACPRCGGANHGEYYGPCPSCCEQLRDTVGGAQRDVVADAFEPKMNVTPNAVASKD